MEWNPYKSLYKMNSSLWIAAAVYQWIWVAALMFQEEMKEVCSLPRKSQRNIDKAVKETKFQVWF